MDLAHALVRSQSTKVHTSVVALTDQSVEVFRVRIPRKIAYEYTLTISNPFRISR